MEQETQDAIVHLLEFAKAQGREDKELEKSCEVVKQYLFDTEVYEKWHEPLPGFSEECIKQHEKKLT